MTAYILRRLLLIVPTMIGIMLVTFVVVQFAPGGPVERLIAQLTGTDPGATARFSGGGTRNPTLMRALADHLRPLGIAVESLPDDWSKAKEAVGFALLADATLRGAPANLPGATGASRATILGKISLGSGAP